MSLSAGSIAFLGLNSSPAGDPIDLSFVALSDIPQGTIITFTANNWNGTSFTSSELTVAWTATSAVAVGSAIQINGLDLYGSGLTTSAGAIAFVNPTRVSSRSPIYAYVGSATSPMFLGAISTAGFTGDNTLAGTGLAVGDTAISFTGAVDIAGYVGPRSGFISFADYRAAIGDTDRWAVQNGGGNTSHDGIPPDAPFSWAPLRLAQSISFSSPSVSVFEGDGGTRTLTFTIQRSGGTAGAVTFSGVFAAGTTDAADYGGALPGSTFSGIIADGASSATVTITISGDTVRESDESFTLALTGASSSGKTIPIGTATATGTISDDDGTVLSSNSSTPVTLTNDDHLTILSGVRLSSPTPVVWGGGNTPAGALLDNFGTITSTSRAISTSGSIGGSFTIRNATGAIVTATGDAVKISSLVAGTSGTVTVNNDGAITSTGTGNNAGQALDLDDINASGARIVIDNGVTGVISAADADAIRAGTNATINNYGQIVSRNASAASDGNDAIDFQSVNTGGAVINFAGGVIDGARHGISGRQPIGVINSGTVIGRSGSGIHMESAPGTTTYVTNRGTITGIAVNGADADGIDVDGLLSIENFGTIQALGPTVAARGLNEALAIGGGFVHNMVGGVIVSDQRAITVDDGNGGDAFGGTTIINDGIINGKTGEAISITGTFADYITNAGSITGSIATGGGDDSITLVGSAALSTGTIDGGAGTDTLYLTSTARGAFYGVKSTNVERLEVQSGDWVLSAGDYCEVGVANGARLYLASSHGVTVRGAFSSSAATDTTILEGGTFEVSGRATKTTIIGGYQLVSNSRQAYETTITSGGMQELLFGGTSDGTIISDGGVQKIHVLSIATGTTVNDGGFQVNWGSVNVTTINGGAQYVYGTANATVINAGFQAVGSGGVATATTLHGGEQAVHGGGTATSTLMDGGSQTVYGTAKQTMLANGAVQYLHSTAIATVINSGGQQNIYADGTSTGTTINAGGYQIDWGGANDTTINGGTQYVYGTATGTMITAGIQHVQSGGVAISTTIGTGQLAYVHDGGAMDGVTFAGPYAILGLDRSSALIGTISGWGENDYIDLGDIQFTDSVTSLRYAQNDDHSGGTLTVSDGTRTATLYLLGQYSAADFTLSSDGHGGTLISDPAVAQQAQLAPALHA